MPLGLDIYLERQAGLCRRCHVAKLELFGSRAEGTARPGSDVDLLVTFAVDGTLGLEFLGLADDLEDVIGHRVDLPTRPRVERDDNPIVQRHVQSAAVTFHVA
jgi:predicted nucleotidyltransferase